MIRRAAILSLAAAAHCALAQVPLQVAALSGSDAPGCPGAQFDVPGPLVVGAEGHWAMGGQLRGSTMLPGERRAVWASSGSPSLVARSGFPAPGTLDLFAPAFGVPAFRAGNIAFAGWTLLTPRPGIWLGPPSSIRLVALAGAPAPGTEGVFTSFALTVPLVNAQGQSALVGELAGVPIDRNVGIWALWSDSLELVAQKGDPAPGAPPGTRFRSFDAPLLTDCGTLAFRARLEGAVGPNNDEAVFAAAPGELAPFFLEGAPAPGLPHALLGPPASVAGAAVGSRNILAIPASTTGVPAGAALFAFHDGQLRLLAGAGATFPGLDQPFASFDASTRVTGSGEVVAQARLAGPAAFDAAILGTHALSGERRVVVRKGASVPARAGLPPGTTFGELTLSAANARGQVLFLSMLGTPAGIRNSLWLHDPAQGPLLVAVAGGDVRLTPADERTVALIGLGGVSGGGDGRPSPLNEAGEAAAFVEFADGSSAVIAFRAPCVADYSRDGQVDLFDYLDFVADFAAEAPAADVNGDNQVDLFDYLDFVAAFDAGC